MARVATACEAGIAGSEIALTWFGIGIQPPHPSFGAMLSEKTGQPVALPLLPRDQEAIHRLLAG